MSKKLLSWTWLERRMEKLALSYRALPISRDTLKNWDNGAEARPFYLRKLAAALEVNVPELVRFLGVRPMRLAKRKAIGRRLTQARMNKGS